ncbi:MAG: hypothetical protein M3Y64_01570, partial [Gemmatimonadota bacterium]|nr:hypothetical protein [Gemmatimonadota bacterium]
AESRTAGWRLRGRGQTRDGLTMPASKANALVNDTACESVGRGHPFSVTGASQTAAWVDLRAGIG